METNEITPSVKEDHVMAQRKVSKWRGFFCQLCFPRMNSQAQILDFTLCHCMSMDYYSHFYSSSLEMNPSDTEAVHRSVHAACLLLAIKL